jgi:glycolate oxidase iron-sulfur subunit
MARQEIKDMVDRCNKFGHCIPSCPVYQQILTEAATPRGRVQLVKNFLEGNVSLSLRAKEIILTCLLCESCVVNCPSGVPGSPLYRFSGGIGQTVRTGLEETADYTLLTNEKVLHSSMVFAKLGRNWLWRPLPRNADRKYPGGNCASIPSLSGPVWGCPPRRESGRPGFLFHRLFTNYFAGDVGQAVINILKKLRLEIEIPKGQDCCGIAAILSGDGDLPLKNVEKNISLLNQAEVDSVLVDCATCGAAFKKEYIALLKRKEWIPPRRGPEEKDLDVMEYVAARMERLPLPKKGTGRRFASPTTTLSPGPRSGSERCSEKDPQGLASG